MQASRSSNAATRRGATIGEEDRPPRLGRSTMAPGRDAGSGLPLVSSAQLLGLARTLVIDHHGQRYILRVTRENKLILTK